jgi:hypothetical protein
MADAVTIARIRAPDCDVDSCVRARDLFGSRGASSKLG